MALCCFIFLLYVFINPFLFQFTVEYIQIETAGKKHAASAPVCQKFLNHSAALSESQGFLLFEMY